MGNQVSLLDENQNPIKALNPLPVTEASAAAILAALVEKASEVTAEAILAKLNAGIPVALTGSNLPLVASNAEIGKIKTDQTETLITAPVTRIVTLTETPVSLNSKANLKQITVRNIDSVLRARIGETGMTPANGKGIALEPFATYQETFDPSVAITIYGRSEGASMQVEVYEV